MAEFPGLERAASDDPAAEISLVVCGCTRGCAADTPMAGERFVICDEGAYGALVESIREMLDSRP